MNINNSLRDAMHALGGQIRGSQGEVLWTGGVARAYPGPDGVLRWDCSDFEALKVWAQARSFTLSGIAVQKGSAQPQGTTHKASTGQATEAALSPNGVIAMAWAMAGIPVHPCKEEGPKGVIKAPYLPGDTDPSRKPIPRTGGVYKASADPHLVEVRWKEWPGAVPGLQLSKYIVVDCDMDPGDGFAELEEILQRNGVAMPVGTPIIITPSGGRHFLLRLPPGLVLKKRPKGTISPSIDLLTGAGCYILAPRGVLKDGRFYAPLDGAPDAIEAVRLGTVPFAPDWLIKIGWPEKPEPSRTSDTIDLNSARPQDEKGFGFTNDQERVRQQGNAWAALAGRISEFQSMKLDSGRDSFLMKAVGYLAPYVTHGLFSRDEMFSRFMQAATSNGLAAKNGREKVESTFWRAFDACKDRPLPDLRERSHAGNSGARAESRAGASKAGPGPDSPSQQDEPIPDPDPSVLRPDHAAVPRFPLEVFREAGPWMKTTAEAMGAPVDYVGTSWLASVAACAGHAYQVEARKGWCEPLVLWFANVGRPSVNKSPAFDPFQRVLYDLQNEANENHGERVGAWKAAAKLAKIAEEQWETKAREATKQGKKFTEAYPEACTEEMPGEYRLMLDDVTPEKAASIMAHTDCRFAPLLFKDELASHVLALDRYGKGDAGRMFWLKAFGARSHTVDRQTAPPIHVRRLAISTLGGIQPDKVVTLMASDDDGLVARFLWAYPQPIDPIWPEIGPDHDALKRALRLLVELPAENPLYASLYLPDDLKRAFHAWTLDHLRETRKTVSGRLEGHFGKMQGMFLRLAGTIQVGLAAWRGGGIPTQISRTSFEAARVLIDEYFKPMAHRTFREEGSKGVQTVTTAAAKYIRRRRLRQITVRDLTTNKIVPNADSAEEALLGLVAARWIKAVEGKVRGGRGQVPVVCPVNPKVHAIPEDDEG